METKTHRYSCYGCGSEVPCIIDVVMAAGTKVNLHNLPRFCPVGKGKCIWRTPKQLADDLVHSVTEELPPMKRGRKEVRSKQKKTAFVEETDETA